MVQMLKSEMGDFLPVFQLCQVIQYLYDCIAISKTEILFLLQAILQVF